MYDCIDDNQLSPAKDRCEVITLFSGTPARLDSVLRKGEIREGVVSIAIEREIRRRQIENEIRRHIENEGRKE
jgi:hypothetical protein